MSLSRYVIMLQKAAFRINAFIANAQSGSRAVLEEGARQEDWEGHGTG